MGKVQIKDISKEVRYAMIGDLYDIVAHAKSKNEIIGFFVGLLTPSEALMLARRIQIAQMLLQEKDYKEIQEKIGAGIATISYVKRWLYENKKFHNEIEKCLERKVKRDEVKQRPRRYYESLLDKYPEHRFMKELLGL